MTRELVEPRRELAARVLREWDVGPVVFVGLSMGGLVAQGLAIRHPQLVRGVVLANTTAGYPPDAHAGFRQRIEAVERGDRKSTRLNSSHRT